MERSIQWRQNQRGRWFGYSYDREFPPIPRHRWVWEQANGPLPDGWDVHHIDRDRGNDELGNLLALPRAEHVLLHAREPHAIVCRDCGMVFDHAGRGRRPLRCPECKQEAVRAERRRADAKRSQRLTTCVECGAEFRTRTGTLCSMRCVNLWSHKHRRGVQLGRRGAA